MADCYRPSMHDDLDDIHRLLPREILSDIGIVDPAEQHVDDLAAHLASVLGGAPKKTPCHHTPAQANAASRESLTGGPSPRRVAVAPPPFLPPPAAAVPWHVMEGFMRRSNMVLHPAVSTPGFTFTPARPISGGGAQPTTASHRVAGTGVFLPRTDQVVVRRTAKAARSPPSKGNHARVIHQRGQQAAAMAILKAQQEMRAAAAAHMEWRYYLGVHPHPELALPLEWTY